jgi:hypothetical protein
MDLDCEGMIMRSSMVVIGRGYLPIGKSPIFNGQKDRYESAEKSYFQGYVFKSEKQRLNDGGRVALLRKAQAHPDYEKFMKLASSR